MFDKKEYIGRKFILTQEAQFHLWFSPSQPIIIIIDERIADKHRMGKVENDVSFCTKLAA